SSSSTSPSRATFYVLQAIVRGAMAGRAAVAGPEGAGESQAAVRPAAARSAALENVKSPHEREYVGRRSAACRPVIAGRDLDAAAVWLANARGSRHLIRVV
ncbi:MAG: hypothetical protein LC808_04915, partial [Actinobacteria bacterium]|nr:hypothetical protein [Actinomycetota bacterium]